MQKGILIFTVILSSIIIGSPAFTQSPQISLGLSWLNSSQTTAGNWPEVSTTEYYSTAAALDAVYALEPASTVYSLGFQWLSGQVVSPTDYLARRIIALKRGGMDASSEIEALVFYRDPIVGGWGIYTSFDDGILDTTLALQALRFANYSDYGVLFQAINYLTANQKTDGGWGFKDDSVSNVYTT